MPRLTMTIDGVDRFIWVGDRKAAVRRAGGWSDADMPDPDDGFPCEDCGFVAKSAAGLASHGNTHDDD